ncbi:MAG TPA: aromatic ring-hydroxylating dioxygenase subunit alpha [Burkholderiaceae bacterium]|nr:aromatic ring-hydroxylating dioxygenase subunit alpha [Burkholderiaceae bacterium]
MIEHTLFHPVAAVADLDAAGAPMAARLLETDLVIWRDADGGVRAFDDRCPHRGAALARGRVVDGMLECPYHGWRFAADGRCMRVPALPDFRPPIGHRAVEYSARVAYGLVWVALTAPAMLPAGSDVPAFAAETDDHLRKVNSGPYEVATSAPRIVENFLDMAHFGFVHEGWLGSRDHVALQPYEVTITPAGFLATECFAWQPKSSIHASGGAMVEYAYEVNAPYTAILTKVPEAGAVKLAQFRESIALFVCPLEPEVSRVWIRLAMNHSSDPDDRLTAFQDTIFGQDRPVLESQRPKRLPITGQAPVRELHCAADRSSAAYRRYLLERGIRFGII